MTGRTKVSSASLRYASFIIVSVRVQPNRDAPTARTISASSRVRTPPAALRRMEDGVLARISFKSWTVAPPGAYPVEVFVKSAPTSAQIPVSYTHLDVYKRQDQFRSDTACYHLVINDLLFFVLFREDDFDVLSFKQLQTTRLRVSTYRR